MRVMIALMGLALAGCHTVADEERCLSYGAQPGTDANLACRSRLAGAHIQYQSTSPAPSPTFSGPYIGPIIGR
jgi:hypothetical protein